MYISNPPSPEVENFQMKIYHPAGDRNPDLLNQRQTCYHLSQRGELFWAIILLPKFLVIRLTFKDIPRKNSRRKITHSEVELESLDSKKKRKEDSESLIYWINLYVCKLFCPEAGPSLDMHYQGSAYLSLLDKTKEWGSMSSPFLTEPVALWEYLSLHTQTQECWKYNY